MGGRPAQAAFYSPQLANGILRGMRDAEEAEHQRRHDQADDPKPELAAAMATAGSLHGVQLAPGVAQIQHEELAANK